MKASKPITTDRQIMGLKPTTNTPRTGDWVTLGHFVKGLYIVVMPSGAKSFYLNYYRPVLHQNETVLNQTAKKQRNKLKLGDYPSLSLADAITTANEYKELIKQGVDPQYAREVKKQTGQLIEQVIRDFFTNFYRANEDTKADNLRKFEAHLFPLIGNRPLDSLTPERLAECYSVIFKKSESVADKVSSLFYRALEVQASKGAVSMADLFAYSKVYEPFRRVRKPSQKMKAVDLADFPKVMQAMNESAEQNLLQGLNKGIKPQTLLLFYFYLLTGMRSSECVKVRWEYIDTAQNLLIMPSDMMKQTAIRQKGVIRDHILPISKPLAEVLNILKRLNNGSVYIFPALSDKSKTGRMNEETIRNALNDVGFKDKQTAHGLRTIVRSYLDVQGVRYEVAESIIDHDTSRRALDKKYIQQNDYIDEKRPVMELIGEFMLEQGMNLSLFSNLK